MIAFDAAYADPSTWPQTSKLLGTVWLEAVLKAGLLKAVLWHLLPSAVLAAGTQKGCMVQAQIVGLGPGCMAVKQSLTASNVLLNAERVFDSKSNGP